METETSSSRSPPGSTPHGYTELNNEESDHLVVACTAFVCLPVDADSLHSCMRLLLRYVLLSFLHPFSWYL